MTPAATDRWPQLQRAIESTPLRRTGRWHPRRLVRRSPLRFPYRPGVYIFAYHTIVDPGRAAAWELAYDKGWVSTGNFARQIAFLARTMSPISLTEAFEIMARGAPDRPYFVITFDDGYRDVLWNAAPAAARFGIRPCVFVNGRFAQGHVYYRILAALLTKDGHAAALRSELAAVAGRTDWSADPGQLFNQTKNHYLPGVMEEAVEKVYRHEVGEPEALGAHLNAEEIRHLHAAGWEIGNHTYDHRLLSRLDGPQIDQTISRNEAFWNAAGVPLVNALAVPNGAVRDVNEQVHAWLQQHESVHAVFGNGGVNFVYDRTQWLRLFAGNGDEWSLHENICAEIKRTIRAGGGED